METNKKDLMIRITDLKKQYRLGKIGAGTLQGDIKEWWSNRHEKTEKKHPNQRFYALDGINLEVHKGETVGIIGRNGAGKSTLLKILSRITAPSKGYVDLYGRVASMLEVGTGFHGEMTGRENVYLNGAILGMSKAEIDSKMDEIIAFSELEEFIDTPVKRYSSGMFVKLGFSVAIHLESEIVIMDEVLAVGDIEFQHKCIERLLSASRNEERTVLFVSHNMNTIRQLCDRCVVLDKGKVIFDGEVDHAIAIYLGTADELPSRIDFGPEYRPNDVLIRLNRRFEMQSIELTNQERPVFKSTQEAVLELDCLAEKDLERVGFRFEIWSQDGAKIGSMLAGNFVDLKQGEHTLQIRLPFAHLASGQYRADVVAFLYDEVGSEDMLDGVYPGFMFQIESVLDEVNYLDWHHKYWGAVRLEDLDVREI